MSQDEAKPTNTTVKSLSSRVLLPHGFRKYNNSTIGTISLQNNKLRIFDDNQTELDVLLTDVKKAKFEMSYLYIYAPQGMKEVNFATKERSSEEVEAEIKKWHEVFVASGVKSKRVVIFFVVLVILYLLSLIFK